MLCGGKHALPTPVSINIVFTFFIALYLCAGALVFQYLENGTLEQPLNNSVNANECLLNVLYLWNENATREFEIIDGILSSLRLCLREPETAPDWSFSSSLLFTFSVTSTIGYGHVSPATVSGRIFFFFYALLGIPLTLVYLANVGKYLTLAAEKLAQKLRNNPENPNDPKDDTSGSATLIFVIFFLIYWSLGHVLFPTIEPMNFFDGFYFSFVTLTTIGFGDIYPENEQWMFLSLLYIGIGLALTSNCIEILSEYLKRLHFYGRKLGNLGGVEVWFGSKRITVNGLLTEYAEANGLPPPSEADMENLLQAAIETQDNPNAKPKQEDLEKGPAKTVPLGRWRMAVTKVKESNVEKRDRWFKTIVQLREQNITRSLSQPNIFAGASIEDRMPKIQDTFFNLDDIPDMDESPPCETEVNFQENGNEAKFKVSLVQENETLKSNKKRVVLKEENSHVTHRNIFSAAIHDETLSEKQTVAIENSQIVPQTTTSAASIKDEKLHETSIFCIERSEKTAGFNDTAEMISILDNIMCEKENFHFENSCGITSEEHECREIRGPRTPIVDRILSEREILQVEKSEKMPTKILENSTMNSMNDETLFEKLSLFIENSFAIHVNDQKTTGLKSLEDETLLERQNFGTANSSRISVFPQEIVMKLLKDETVSGNRNTVKIHNSKTVESNRQDSEIASIRDEILCETSSSKLENSDSISSIQKEFSSEIEKSPPSLLNREDSDKVHRKMLSVTAAQKMQRHAIRTMHKKKHPPPSPSKRKIAKLLDPDETLVPVEGEEMQKKSISLKHDPSRRFEVFQKEWGKFKVFDKSSTSQSDSDTT